MALTIQYTAGYIWTVGEIVTEDKLNLAANPIINLFGSISSASIANGSVTTAKLAVGVISADAAGATLVANGALTTAMYADGSVTAAKLATAGALPPTGSITMFAGETVPTGWLECNGASVSATTYPALATALVSVENSVNYIYGGTVAGGNFNLPDLRGKFARGWDHGAGNDPDAAARTDRGDGVTGNYVGTMQADGFKSHTHAYNVPSATEPQSGNTTQCYVGTAPTASGATGGNETRPVNINLMFIIKT